MAYARINQEDQGFVVEPGDGYITITSGMSGHFAVHVWINPDGNFFEPYNSGIGRYDTPIEAAKEALMWAVDEEMPCVLSNNLWDQLKAEGFAD